MKIALLSIVAAAYLLITAKITFNVTIKETSMKLVGMYLLGVATLASATVALNMIEQTRCARQYNVYTCQHVAAFIPVVEVR